MRRYLVRPRPALQPVPCVGVAPVHGSVIAFHMPASGPCGRQQSSYRGVAGPIGVGTVPRLSQSRRTALRSHHELHPEHGDAVARPHRLLRHQGSGPAGRLRHRGCGRPPRRHQHGRGRSGYGGTASAPQHEGFLAALKDMFMPEEDRYSYAEGLRRGGYLVSVKTGQVDATACSTSSTATVPSTWTSARPPGGARAGRDTGRPQSGRPLPERLRRRGGHRPRRDGIRIRRQSGPDRPRGLDLALRRAIDRRQARGQPWPPTRAQLSSSRHRSTSRSRSAARPCRSTVARWTVP